MNGHTAQCSLAMYRGPRVCICGADARRSTPTTDEARPMKCRVSRQWGNGRTAWRCNLEQGHDGKHFDPTRQMYWGDVVIAAKGIIR